MGALLATIPNTDAGGLAHKFAHVSGVRTRLLLRGKQARVRRWLGRLRFVRSSHAAARLQRYCFAPVAFTRRLSNEVTAFAQD
jgi:hypothetical protein